MENCKVNDCIKRELERDIARLEKGIREIKGYLEEKQPRVGDATFICEALLAK